MSLPIGQNQFQPILELSGISKHFSGVQALNNVSLRLYPGEVHALMGQNGAGKSTLIKVLTGLHFPDQGRMTLDGKPIQPTSTQHAQQLGISTVYQEVNLCPNLSVAENIFIGRYPRRFGAISWTTMRNKSIELLHKLKVDIDVTRPLASFSLAMQQMVAIARALNISCKLLILDEPTSSLDEAEVQLLFGVLRELRAQGIAILFVTHFLDQTYAISDRITVMRNGELEGEYVCSELPRLTLVNKMIGQVDALGSFSKSADFATSSTDHTFKFPFNTVSRPAFLSAVGVGKKMVLPPLDLTIYQGELLGFSGLLGSGRTETARLLFGADQADSGHLIIDGKRTYFRSPLDAISRRIGFCSEDRKKEGAILALSVRENMHLALQAQRGWRRQIPIAIQKEQTWRMVRLLGIKVADIDMPIAHLSGGNQQKVLLARWLLTDPKMLILDEPTRGIDVHAKQEIMGHIRRLSDTGMTILLISSELSDVIDYSDRIIVFRDRAIVGEFAGGELNQDTMQQVIAGNVGAAPIYSNSPENAVNHV